MTNMKASLKRRGNNKIEKRVNKLLVFKLHLKITPLFFSITEYKLFSF